MQLPENKVLDEVSEHYRHTYLLRRIFATLLEVDSALIQLNAHATFNRELPKFQANQLRDWKAAIDFFAEKKAVIKDRRNVYGGHFQANVPKYILGLLDDSEESVGVLEVRLSDDHSLHYVFKFAETLVNVGLFYDRVSLIRFRGHFPKGGDDVQNGITHSGKTRTPAVQ